MNTPCVFKVLGFQLIIFPFPTLLKYLLPPPDSGTSSGRKQKVIDYVLRQHQGIGGINILALGRFSSCPFPPAPLFGYLFISSMGEFYCQRNSVNCAFKLLVLGASRKSCPLPAVKSPLRDQCLRTEEERSLAAEIPPYSCPLKVDPLPLCPFAVNRVCGCRLWWCLPCHEAVWCGLGSRLPGW